MIVVYTPAGGEPEHYDASTLRVSEASIVQRTVDMKWQEIASGLDRDDLDAMRGIIWVLKKRAQPSLRFGEFDPGVNEMTTVMDDREVDNYIDNAFRVAEAGDTAEEVADLLQSHLPDISMNPERTRARIAERLAGPKAEPETEPAPEETASSEDPSPSPTSSTPEASTSDSSPTSSTSRRRRSTS
ncbi:hypothetical protein SAMN05216532_4020 [Streptomyces sp. 2231.1]|uniref:hypothetical protein n=1 Tax=Streptomyces sp. 2231.1 TaxID=1855347 RepID=UPI000897182B|nr:hypothetical protein [Streptomyces sp. 2231.1]SED27179.1 hypothetical protein SAMN05216532_4020 [Streptomyces sp. 2231.1]